MRIRTSLAAASLLALTTLVFWGYSRDALSGFEAGDDIQSGRERPGRGGFEVWIADQSDTRPGFGGQLLIYEGSHLMGISAGRAKPIVRLDLGGETADVCRAATKRNPVRPHMVVFNNTHTHAILSFVASGHVVIFDAVRRRPLTCFETKHGEHAGARPAALEGRDVRFPRRRGDQ
jgi:hypothetical protein